MYKNYFNIDELILTDIKKKYIFEKKYYAFELSYNSKVRHDLMSYGIQGGKYVSNFDTLRYLALNPDKNIIDRTIFNKESKQYENVTGPLCFVEYKTKYYKMVFDYDFKVEKYPELYNGYIDSHEEITFYINSFIVQSLKETLNKPDTYYITSVKKKSIGYHIYFPNIVTDKILHKYICDITLKKIIDDKKYPIDLIKQIFDDCVAGANGVRLWYYVNNGDFYYPIQEKSTYKFPEEAHKHFHLCILNTDYINYKFDLLIDENIIYDNNLIIDTKQKAKDVKKGIIKSNFEYAEDFKVLDIGDKKDLFLGLSKIIKKERIDCRNTWIQLINMFINYGIEKNEIIELSKKSNKFDDRALKTIDDMYSRKIKKSEKTITMGTLVLWAKEDSLIETNKLFSKYYLSLKLNVDNIDEILLSFTKIKPNYKESEKHISDKAIEQFKLTLSSDTNCIIMKSPTNTGKTTAIITLLNYYLDTDANITVLSIVTRRSMSACHLSSFNDPKNKSKFKFYSYLNESIESIDYFISSLENLIRVDDGYDVIILDEINSLINYFYSSTLNNKRLKCIKRLLELINKSKLVIGVDANITDMVFVLLHQLNKKIYYYENKFENKKDIPLNIFYSAKKSNDSNILAFCEKFIINQYVNLGKSALILTDSKDITDFLKRIFLKHNSNEDYYRIFNKDEGTLTDMIKINEVGENRLCIASPRWCYGLDVKVKYDEIFVIYDYTSGLQSMGALEMIQQISRARETKCVNLLCLDPEAKYAFNQYISFEDNKKIQESYINGYSKFYGDLCKKYDAINEMGCTLIDVNGKIKFNNDSFMTQIHYLKTWYDQLFHKNKIDIIKLIAKDYGYKIKSIDFNPEPKFVNYLKKDLKLKKEEVIEVSKKIFKNEEVDSKYKFCIDNLKEQINMRQKYLHNINDNNLIMELACDHKKFINYINKIYLDLNKADFNKKIIELSNGDILHMIKDNELINKINVCFWFEELLNFDRLNVNDIKYDDFDKIKKIFNENIEKFYFIFKNNECKYKTIKSIKCKFECIVNLNYLQKFIVECYNNVVEDIILVKKKRIRINANKEYMEYSFN